MDQNFQRLYQEYHQDLFQFLLYLVRNREVAEDIVQEVYIRVLKSYDSFKGDCSEKTWLFSIARNISIDYFRKQKRMESSLLTFFDIEEKAEIIEDPNRVPEEICVLNEEIQDMYHCLGYCTTDQRSVLILRFIQSMSVSETASILNMNLNKVKSIQARGLKKLRSYLEERNHLLQPAKALSN